MRLLADTFGIVIYVADIKQNNLHGTCYALLIFKQRLLLCLGQFGVC